MTLEENAGGNGDQQQHLMSNGFAKQQQAEMVNGNEVKAKEEESNNGAIDVVQLVQSAYEAMGMGRNFNRLVKGIRIVSACPPTILAELTVHQGHANDKGTMHGGCTAALVDILTATAVRLLVPESPIVSIDLSISYLAPVKLGDTILLEAICLKAGHSVAFTDASFRRRGDNQILIRARQQLAILSAPKPNPTVPAAKMVAPVENGAMAAEVEPKKIKKEKLGEAAEEVVYSGGGQWREEMQRIFAEMPTKGNFYGRIPANVEVLHAEPPLLAVKIRLGEEHLNNAGSMHGGFTATLVDIVTSRAVSMTDKCPKSSLDLSVSYLLPAKLGDEIVVEGKCLKIGRMMAFTETTFRRQRDGALVAKGKHNMFMLRHKQQLQKHTSNGAAMAAVEVDGAKAGE